MSDRMAGGGGLTYLFLFSLKIKWHTKYDQLVVYRKGIICLYCMLGDDTTPDESPNWSYRVVHAYVHTTRLINFLVVCLFVFGRGARSARFARSRQMCSVTGGPSAQESSLLAIARSSVLGDRRPNALFLQFYHSMCSTRNIGKVIF